MYNKNGKPNKLIRKKRKNMYTSKMNELNFLNAVEEESISGTETEDANTLQQFGMVPFEFAAHDEFVEVEVHLDQPYANAQYAFVAMGNHPSCYTVLKEQTAKTALFQVVRAKFSPSPQGMVTWIAIGEKA
jgi:hypothetical protein